MDIFDVLTAISKKKLEFIHAGMDGNEALIKAEFDVSEDYNIQLVDIKKLVGL